MSSELIFILVEFWLKLFLCLYIYIYKSLGGLLGFPSLGPSKVLCLQKQSLCFLIFTTYRFPQAQHRKFMWFHNVSSILLMAQTNFGIPNK